ncbi:MAG TPA: diguanylate cyclase [Candidatus Dormibacteraeota bacterium]|nr:diguanylate cyclase [Candidatus Dormibacteraeota bacterium]
MKNEPGGTPSKRWQDIRALAIDATFDADRRRVGERVAVVFRWLFLVVLGVLNNVNPHTTANEKVTIDFVLAGWGAMNVGVNVLLVRGYQPGKQFSLSTMTLDILFATTLVYLSNGFNSPFFLALFLAVITNAVRFGATASFVSALVVSFLYLFVGGSFTPSNFAVDPNATIGKMFLFLVVALATGYMTRELERERRSAVERAAQADSLRELSMNLVGSTDIKDVFVVLTDHAVQMTSADRGRLILSSQEGFTVVAGANRSGALAPAAEDEPMDEHQLSQAAITGEAVFAADNKGLVVPIASGDGVTAILSLSQSAGVFTNQDLFAVNALSGSTAVTLANALRYQRSRQEATTDGLTGLANVREFRRRLEGAFARPDRSGTPISLLLIDFDHFKSVNDELGHQHGDLVLQMGARIVKAAARAQDMVARYGGDELAVMVADTNATGAQRLAYRIVDAVHAAAVSTTPDEHLTFSIGVASYPEDAFTASELIAAADQALYLAKREGKNRACTFPQLVTELELADGGLVPMLADAGPQVMIAVAHAVDHRSPVTQGHSSRVASIAEAIGRRSGLSSDQTEDLRTAAFLHDVGHMTLSTGGQTAEAPGHAEEGEKIVAGAKFPLTVVAAVRHHHDRWDAGGRADGLMGSDIPMLARILAVAEKFEASTAGRGCVRITSKAAQDQVVAGAGTEFDPAIVEALGRAVRDGSFELTLPDLAFPAVAAVPAPAAV